MIWSGWILGRPYHCVPAEYYGYTCNSKRGIVATYTRNTHTRNHKQTDTHTYTHIHTHTHAHTHTQKTHRRPHTQPYTHANTHTHPHPPEHASRRDNDPLPAPRPGTCTQQKKDGCLETRENQAAHESKIPVRHHAPHVLRRGR